MQCKCLIFLILFIPSFGICANTNIDSLENLLSSSVELTPEDQIEIYSELSRYYAFEIPASSLKYAKELHKLGEVTQDLNVQGDALRKMGMAYENLRDYEKALSNFISAITLFELLEDQSKIGQVYNDIAELYIVKGDINDAESYFDKSIAIFRTESHPRNLVRSLTGLGYFYNERNQYEKSRELYREALNIVLGAGKKNMASSIYTNLAQTYIHENNKVKTYELMDSALFVADETLAALIRAEHYQSYGEAMIDFEDYENALIMLKKSQNAISGGLVGDFLLRNIEVQAKCYKYLGDINSAHKLLEKHIVLSDSISNRVSEENYKRFQALFETQEKENEILAYQEKEQASTYKLILLVALLIILSLAGVIVYINYKRKVERLNYQIYQRDSELKGFALNIIEKNKILKNIRQRLKTKKSSDDIDDIPSIIFSENPELDEKLVELERSFQYDLSDKYQNLTDREKQMCSLLKLNISSKEIADLLNVSSRSVDTYRYRIRKKMALNPNDSLSEALDNL